MIFLKKETSSTSLAQEKNVLGVDRQQLILLAPSPVLILPVSLQ